MASPTAVAPLSLTPASHVLIIEDDADACANLRDILELDEFQVATAGSIADALDIMSHETIEMIILDRRLPDGSAEEALPRLKAKAPDAAVIIITGYADLDGVITALREGADDYLLKPVNPDLLRNTLEQIRYRQQMSLEKRRTENAFRALVEAAGCMIVIVRPDRTVAYFNSFSEELTGYRRGRRAGARFLRDLPARERSAAGPPCLWLRARRRQPAELSVSVAAPRRVASRPLVECAATRRLHGRTRAPGGRSGHHDAQGSTGSSLACRASGGDRTDGRGAGARKPQRAARSQACLEMLELEIGENVEAQNLLRRIQKAQDQLHKLFEEVRGYVAPIQLDRCECQLSEAWREAWESLASQRRGRKAELRELPHTVDLHCYIDRFRMVQVFRNLLENSLAACQDPAAIEISCTRTQLHGRDAVRVAVRDNGPGLTADQRTRIFEPFFTTKTHGTGLGMPIAKRIVAAHEGDLSVGDQGHPGAELLVTLPRLKP